MKNIVTLDNIDVGGVCIVTIYYSKATKDQEFLI